MTKKRLASALTPVVFYAALNVATAAPVSYTFSTAPTTFNSPLSAFFGSSLSGTFSYDSAAPQTFTVSPSSANLANASGYGPHGPASARQSSFSAFNATIAGGGFGAGFAFSDPIGDTVVSKGGLITPPGSDFLGLGADPFGPGGTHNIVPFSFGGYTLWNMRLFWHAEHGFTLTDQSLPSVLPDITGRISLDFVPTDTTTAGTPLSFVFYDVTVAPTLAAIPEPETYALLLAGLGLLGFVASRRKQLARRT